MRTQRDELTVPQSAEDVHTAIEGAWRSESRRVLATLVRLLGDFDRAEEALHDAFAAAVERWPVEGVPRSPRAWLVSAGRFRAIDAMRRRARFDAKQDAVLHEMTAQVAMQPEPDDEGVADDQLRMIFTCCHPALAPEARVALTLREVCGLTTEEIARAWFTTPSTIAQRIVRAKARIRDARIPYVVPARAELPSRLDAVLQVIYLVFSEGYAASSGDRVTRHDLSAEAIRLARALHELLPEREVAGLLALMLLHESRRATRTDEEQDRSRWDRALIHEGTTLVRRALGGGGPGPYAVQAAIAAVHADAPSAAATDWHEVVALYDVLATLVPTPVVALNRAVAVAMRDGPAAGLALVDALIGDGALAAFHLAHAARAELCARLGRTDEARAAYAEALRFVSQEPERRFLQRRTAALA